jgi:hypothetical protein
VIHRNLQPSDGYSLRLDFVLEFYSKPRIAELLITFRSRSIGIQPDEAEDDNFVAMRKECSTKNNTPLYSVGATSARWWLAQTSRISWFEPAQRLGRGEDNKVIETCTF